MMNITVFGSASGTPGTTLYETSRELGALLAREGHTLITGGYIGTMEAVSQGANEAGGKTIGVTCAEIEAFRAGGANPWVQVAIPSQTLTERLDKMIRNSDAMIALPGGIGTLTEISLSLNLMVIGAIPARILILVGKPWHLVIDNFFNTCSDYIPEELKSKVKFAADPQEALTILKNSLEE